MEVLTAALGRPRTVYGILSLVVGPRKVDVHESPVGTRRFCPLDVLLYSRIANTIR
jgi:hypothetical protein